MKPLALALLGCLLLTAGCHEGPEDNSGCCYYLCDGGQAAFFTAWFGGDDLCLDNATSACQTADATNPGVTQAEWLSVTPSGEASGLTYDCEVAAPSWFNAALP